MSKSYPAVKPAPTGLQLMLPLKPASGIDYGGFIPKGRLAEDGVIPDHYANLIELSSASYRVRTERNVCTADATLILTMGKLTNGSALTRRLAQKHGKPFLHLDLSADDEERYLHELRTWLSDTDCRILNVAGSRESHSPGIYGHVRKLLKGCLRDCS